MKMRTTVVTGAAGRIGGRVAAQLRKLGHRVVGVDLAPAPAGLIGSSCDDFVQCNLAAAADDASAAHAALSEACSAASVVVHCAAWPGPSSTPPPAVVASGAATDNGIGLEPASPSVLLRDNVGATSAVCDAAVRGGAVRFVFSSSAFAVGWSHAAAGTQAYRPRYMPVDEAHGALPHETYGLSKLAGEQVLEAAARTARDTSFVSLRFPNIIKAERWGTLPWPAPTAAAPLNLLMWAYAHEDDVVDAHVAAATRPDAAAVGTHEAYLIAAPDSRFAEPTLELLETVLGLSGVPTRPGFGGNDSPLSSAKAAERLGWRPRSWRQQHDAATELKTADADATVGSLAASMPPYGLGSGSALRARADPALRHFDLSGFVLRSGAALPVGATLAYRVHGPPVGEAPGGVILHPTSFDAVRHAIACPRLPCSPTHATYTLECMPARWRCKVCACTPAPSPSTAGARRARVPDRAGARPRHRPLHGGGAQPPRQWRVVLAFARRGHRHRRQRAQAAVGAALATSRRHHCRQRRRSEGDAARGAGHRVRRGESAGARLWILDGSAAGVRMGRGRAGGRAGHCRRMWRRAVCLGSPRLPHCTRSPRNVCEFCQAPFAPPLFRCGELNHIFLRSIEAALKADSAWDDAACRFSHRPTRGLEAFSAIYAGWGVGEAWCAPLRWAASPDRIVHPCPRPGLQP